MNDTPDSAREEETAALVPAEDTETVPLEDEDAAMTTEEDEEEEDVYIDPMDERVFGMPRMCFYGVGIGVAGGYIVSGLLGLILNHTPSAATCALICAGIGYLVAHQLHKKRLAAREEEESKP